MHSLCDMQDLMRSMGVSSAEVSTSGGGARSAVWRQIQADMLGCDVLTRQGAAEGAALDLDLAERGFGRALADEVEQATRTGSSV